MIERYNNVPVITSNLLINILAGKKARGFTLLSIIILRKEISGSLGVSGGLICSTSGCKPRKTVLKHEYDHIMWIRDEGYLKFIYKYLTDGVYREQFEERAKIAENN